MKNIKQTFSKTKLALSLSAALLLIACGGTDQDDGTASGFEQTFSGRAIDGYLARATVFIDGNNNGTRDPWETFAFTDNEGYYSFNPNTNTDYCAAGATPQQQQYCLNANTQYSNVVVRIDGGYDVLTGEPFLGQMSRRINLETLDDSRDVLVSPISSLLSNIQTENEQSSLLGNLGLDQSDLNVDYLNTDGQDAVDSHLLNTSLKIHKVVAVLSDRLTDTYIEIGEDFGTPNDASSAIYPSLAEQIINSGNTLDQALASEDVLISTLDTAETKLRKVYERKEFDLPADMGSLSNAGAFQRVVSIASEIPSIVNTLIDINNNDFSFNDALGGTRALEALVIKTVSETNEDDKTIDPTIVNVIDFFKPENNNADLVEELLRNLSSETADLKSLVGNDFTGADFDSIEDITTASTLPDNVTPFSEIGGYSLKISDLDLGHAPDKLDDSEVEFYFNGNTNDLEGSFSACVKHVDDANIDGTLGEGNTRGELVDGFWSMLGASESDQSTYSLLITLTFLGTTYQAIIKPAGNETVGDTEYKIIRTDNDGDLRAYHSVNGLTQTASVPSTNEACEARLPSRIGI